MIILRARCRPTLGALLLALASLATPLAAQAPQALRLPRLFQDGMVVQREVPVRVWGWAPAGTGVSAGMAGRTVQAVADARGEWSAELPALPAGGPHTLEVAGGGRRITVVDVLAGDVWVASGQSNMEWPLWTARGGQAAVAAAQDRGLREFAVPHGSADGPEADLAGGAWTYAEPAHAGRFSAVGYYFARELRAAVQVPIGIIHTSWGGSNIETWLSREAQGLTAAEWQARLERERARDAATLATLRARLGPLPEADAGLVAGRAVWADPALDDASWDSVRVPSLWEASGYEGLDGIAWYRTSFTLSAEEAAAGVQVSLGTIDDDDITWVNGVEVGRTQGYATRRRYAVPPRALRGGRNVLAVRVSDGGGGGGLYGDAGGFGIDVASVRRPLAGTWKFRVGQVSLQADGQRINKIPTVLYNRMLHPLLRFPIRGVIWYQGESNANDDAQARAYRAQFVQLIESWRREWRASGEFPFLWVQLPNFGAVDTVPPARAAWATLRESQAAALALPRTGQAVAIDVGDAGDIHPREKETVGKRLALLARRLAYGQDVLASGPRLRTLRPSGERIILEFDDVGSGLELRGETRGAFAIAGEDRRWVWAEARVTGSTLEVWSPAVRAPVAVRYAWSNSPAHAPLYNREGLPAHPFRTDSW